MNTKTLNRTKYWLAISFALYLLLFYFTSFSTVQLTWFWPLVILAFAVDILLVNRLLIGFCKVYQRTDLDVELANYLQSTLKIPLFYRLIKNELLVVFYGFFAKHFSPPFKQNVNTASYANASNAKDVFWLALIAQLPTLPFIHFIVDKEGGAFIAWVVTTLTLWSVVYYGAQVQAVKWRPIEVSDSHLHFKYGIACSADIPLANIKSVSRLLVNERYDCFSHYVSPLGSKKNTLFEFDSEVTFYSAYGLPKKRKKAVICVDEPQQLIELINNANS